MKYKKCINKFLVTSIMILGSFFNQVSQAQNMNERIDLLKAHNERLSIQGIDLLINMSKIQVVTDKTQNEIYQLNPQIEYPFFTGLFKARMGISASSLSYDFTGKGYRLKGAQVSINFNPVMYLPTELNPYPCTKQHTALHELKHWQFEIENIRHMRDHISHRLQVFSQQVIQATKEDVANAFAMELRKIQFDIIKESDILHKTIDNLESYESEAAQCPQEQHAVYKAIHKIK